MAVQQKSTARQYRIVANLTDARYGEPSIDVNVWNNLSVDETRQLISDLTHTIGVVERERLEEVKERQQEGVRVEQEKKAAQFVVPSPPVTLERQPTLDHASPQGPVQWVTPPPIPPFAQQSVRCALPPQACDVCGVWVDGQDVHVQSVGGGQGSWAGHRDCVRT